MRIAKVVGMAVATVKDRRLEGSKLLLVAAADPAGRPRGCRLWRWTRWGPGRGSWW